jgi:YVTN family beta-propeller protein
MRQRIARGGLRVAALVAAAGVLTVTVRALSAQRGASDARETQTFVDNGVRVTFDATPLDSTQHRLREGQNTRLRIGVTDAATGEPLAEHTIAAWVDRRTTGGSTSTKQCTQHIESYLQADLAARPAVDLNSYFLLALNRGNSISVLDPFMGFGSSHLYTTVQLPGIGEDWVLAPDGNTLYVTIPQQNLVAAVDVATWAVTDQLEVPTRPMRVRVQPDGARLWVATDVGDSSGVTAIDPATRRVLGHVATGHGHHEIAFTGDSRYALVSNPRDGTVTVIETSSIRPAAKVTVGGTPVGLAYSAVGHAVYVAGADGTITIIDPAARRVRDRLHGSEGLVAIRFDPSGRWGFILNAKSNEAFVLDATVDSVTHAFQLTGTPDQVAFSHSFAYVRSVSTADVMMIPLHDLAPGEHASSFANDYAAGTGGAGHDSHGGSVSGMPFPAGSLAPGKFGDVGIAAAISNAPEHHDAIYIPNPGEKAIYYYHYMEGMPTPSGSIDNYGFEPLATMTVGRKIDETAPGMYSATVKLPVRGSYDLVFLLEEPRVVHCFPFEVMENPRLESTEPPHLVVEAVREPPLVPGRVATVQFRLRDRRSKAVHAGVAVRAEIMSTNGWHKRFEATPASDSTYAVRFTVPRSGIYYLSVAVPELHLGYRDQSPLMLHTEDLAQHLGAR